MNALDFTGIIVAVVAALGAWAAQRAASKASAAGSRLDAEKDAYERARKMDIETITRQDAEIIDLRRDNGLLQSELNSVKEDNTNLRATVRRLERRLVKLEDISPQLEELLRKRLEEADDHH